MLALHWCRICRDSRFLWREVDLKVGTRRNSKPRVGMGQLSHPACPPHITRRLESSTPQSLKWRFSPRSTYRSTREVKERNNYTIDQYDVVVYLLFTSLYSCTHKGRYGACIGLPVLYTAQPTEISNASRYRCDTRYSARDNSIGPSSLRPVLISCWPPNLGP